VTVSIPSLTLGSVTKQAMGADFFNMDEYPTATFTADLMASETGQVARGTLTIRDQSVPVEMPFDLTIEDNTATATGGLTVDRRDFNIGQGVSDEGSLGYSVEIRFDLTATRGGGA